MSVVVSVLAAVVFFTLISGWLLLLGTTVLTASAVVVGTPFVAAMRVRDGARRGAEKDGVLCIDGLAGKGRLAARLHEDLVRVLALAPRETKPRACACVKPAEGSTVGVLRVYNSKGHYLLRTEAANAQVVADHFSAELGKYQNTFPAKPGARRQSCPECQPKLCPLRRANRQEELRRAA